MQRPPRPARLALLARDTLLDGLLEGALLLATVLAIYVLALPAGTEQSRTLAVVALTAGNLTLVWVNTGSHRGVRNPARKVLLVIATLAAAALGVAIALPAARGLLQFAVPAPLALAAAVAAAAGSVLLAAAVSRGGAGMGKWGRRCAALGDAAPPSAP